MEQAEKARTETIPDKENPPQRCGRGHYFPGVTDAEWNDWRWQFRNRITTIEELEKLLPLPVDKKPFLQEVLSDFRMGITPYYFSLINADDQDDPILRQVVPLHEEYKYRDLGEEDPLAEEEYSPVPGITHRYPDRALMVISNSCAIYCRYCTRKRIMYEDAVADVEVDRMVDYIAKTPSIRDVVVSGGDPLTNSTSKLESILSKLRAVPHLEIIRIGSRVPVSLPQRIDDELCNMLQKYHPLWINVHFNHPRELATPEVARALDKLSRSGIPLNNQSVLLKGVNDSVETMKGLVHALMRHRVRPYYMYQCDPIRGSEHFRTTIAKGIEIIEGLRGHTSGLAVPTYVVDAPGGGGKIPVAPQYLLYYDSEHGRAVLRNFKGKVYEYFEPDLDNALARQAKPVVAGEGLETHVDTDAPVTLHDATTADLHAAPVVSGNGKNGNGHANGNGHSNGKRQVVGKSSWAHRGFGTNNHRKRSEGKGE